MEKIFLQFDFKTINKTNEPLQFTNPAKIFTTNKVEEVKPILEALEKENRAGKYIAGYLSYEAAQAFEPSFQPTKKTTMPLIWFASFDYPNQNKHDSIDRNYHISDWQSVETWDDYKTSIEVIQKAIKDDKTKQVNYTTRLTSQFSGSTFAFYQQLLKNQQANYSAYLNIGHHQILSASPELFFEINEDKIATRPMKGTIKRGRTLKEDEANKAFLLNSEKERAENLMIVDVLKDDLSKLAIPGTVSVPKELEIETYPTLHQMTSTVTAKLQKNNRIVDWFTALFPCGSITGTPRLETMQLIEQLETAPRNVYCGAIGYITPERKAIFNVPIRTVIIDQAINQATYGVGGGITAASKASQEYEETQVKADFVTKKRRNFSLIESLLLTGGHYPYLRYHLDRLKQSASYFCYPYDQAEIREQLNTIAEEFLTDNYKVRLLLDSKGEVKLTAEKIERSKKQIKSYLAKSPINNEDPFLYHKTTIRDQYDSLSINEPDNFSTLLWNEQEELTEFTIGNIVLKINGKYLTPPIRSGVLAGTFRQHLLDQGKISEATLTKSNLKQAEEVWFVNAVRGWIKVDEILENKDLISKD